MDEITTPKPKSKPMRYPRSMTALVTEETYRAAAELAVEEGVSKGVVIRRWIDAGRAVTSAAAEATD